LLKATAEGQQSEDEFPSGVDLNDPYFAEELEKTGGSGQFWNKSAFSLNNRL